MQVSARPRREIPPSEQKDDSYHRGAGTGSASRTVQCPYNGVMKMPRSAQADSMCSLPIIIPLVCFD